MFMSNERQNLTDGEGWLKCSNLGIAVLGLRIAVMIFFPERTEFDFNCNEENNWTTYVLSVETECTISSALANSQSKFYV